MAQQITIKGTPVTAANEVLVADSNSKIPAVDGSQVTAMSGTNVGTGTVATARLDTGTTANKIVALDGTAKIPAVDGSLLTGIVSYTKSASDPTISTNPSGGVGTEWVNHTSGKQFICTDATAGQNVWSCSGSHSGDIFPWTWGGENYGFYPGRGNPDSGKESIYKFSFTSDGNATDHGDLPHTGIGGTGHASMLMGSSSTTHGYASGGGNGPPANTNNINKFAFSANVLATDVGDLSVTRYNGTAAHDQTYTICMGGFTHPGSSPNSGVFHDVMDRFSFATAGTATDHGNLAYGIRALAGGSSETHGYVAGGCVGGSPELPSPSIIQKVAFATAANATGVGNLFQGVCNVGANSSTTYGYVTAGMTTGGGQSHVNTIQKYSFTSDGNAVDVSNLLMVLAYTNGCNSTTHGYTMGGTQAPSGDTDMIQKFNFSTGADATDVGNLLSIADGSANNCQY